MENQKTLRLLIVEESRNDAEALANILRNAGQASRLNYADDAEDVGESLDQGISGGWPFDHVGTPDAALE